MSKIWESNIDEFLLFAHKHQVRMLMVGGGAVNFHGYQRHSADVDFWIDTSEENLERLLTVLREMGYDLNEFPSEVKDQKQNISIKFSPADINLELITKFDINKSFDEAYEESVEVVIGEVKLMKYHVLSLDDLITSKIKSGRPKDLLDVMELKRIHG
ncbi:MAG TPA: nucleotidyl transferase AbiEii/AbiGii toxin family protein [Taishania sp.]|nr:nucleotidyl transferase AbiEii/AbiGii toxin family protein [Taishania sp.]